jgi:primosomal protein N' (replication factor Y)
VLGYPPYSRLVSLRLDARDANLLEARAQQLAGTLREHAGGLGLGLGAVLGPAAPPIERLRGRHRRQILLRHADVRALRALARRARAEEGALRRAHVRLAIDVDPYSML